MKQIGINASYWHLFGVAIVQNVLTIKTFCTNYALFGLNERLNYSRGFLAFSKEVGFGFSLFCL
jgi:hypothetical protein